MVEGLHHAAFVHGNCFRVLDEQPPIVAHVDFCHIDSFRSASDLCAELGKARIDLLRNGNIEWVRDFGDSESFRAKLFDQGYGHIYRQTDRSSSKLLFGIYPKCAAKRCCRPAATSHVKAEFGTRINVEPDLSSILKGNQSTKRHPVIQMFADRRCIGTI